MMDGAVSVETVLEACIFAQIARDGCHLQKCRSLEAQPVLLTYELAD
jgi:hypothetical protein